jgi:hypothetical protein
MPKNGRGRLSAVPAPEGQALAPPMPGIGPMPVPHNWNISQASTPDGKTWVMITLTTPMGQMAFFLEPEVAVKIGEGITQMGRAGDIILAPGGSMPDLPPGAPGLG